jgi:hypothetical protein
MHMLNERMRNAQMVMQRSYRLVLRKGLLKAVKPPGTALPTLSVQSISRRARAPAALEQGLAQLAPGGRHGLLQDNAARVMCILPCRGMSCMDLSKALAGVLRDILLVKLASKHPQTLLQGLPMVLVTTCSSRNRLLAVISNVLL